MARSTGRRSGGQYGRRRDEEYGRDMEPAGREEGREKNADSLIADMAKGFVEAQAKIGGPPSGGANREMLALLEKISRQLAQLQAAPSNEPDAQKEGGQSSQPAGSQGQGKQQAELSAIFSRLLSENKGTDGAAQKNAGQGAGQGGGQRQSRQSSGKQQGGQAGGDQTVTAQTAAQVLAQAQYELANELEASLAKLKQVIGESEKLADRISNLLGQESGSRQT